VLGFLARVPLLNRLPFVQGPPPPPPAPPPAPEPFTRFDSLAELIARRAKRIVAIAAIFFIVGGAIGGSVFKVLMPFGFDDPATESIVARDRLGAAAGADSEPGVVVLVHGKGKSAARSPATVKLVRSAEQVVAADPHIVRTASIAPVAPGGSQDQNRKDQNRKDQNRKASGPLPGMVSKDGRLTYVLGFFRHPTADDVKQDSATAMGRRLERLGPGVQLGGIAVAYEQINKQVEHDLRIAEMIVFPLLFLLSFWVFRGLIAAALPPLTGALAIVGALLGLRLVAEVTDLSIFAVNLVTAVGLGLAIDYSLFVVSRYREELARAGTTAQAALRRTMRTAGRTVLFSGLTVAGSLASLLIFPQRFLYSMGVGGTLVALFAAGVSLTILPAVLWLLGDRIDSLAPRALQRRGEATLRPATHGVWYRLSRVVMARPAIIALAAAAVMIAAGLPFLRVNWNFADARVLPASASARQVDHVLQTRFPANRTDPIQIEVDRGAKPRQLAAYQKHLRHLGDVEQVTPPVTAGHGVRQINVFYRHEHFADSTQQLVRDIRNLDPPFAVNVGGSAGRFIDQNASLVSHLPLMLAIIAVVTLGVLFLMTGSVILPIKALIMNLLTISSAFGILVLVFQDGRFESLLSYEGFGGVDSSNALLLFAVAFGLSTDYGVFLLTRIKEAYDAGVGNNEAVAIGMERTGRLITAAALLLCVAVLGFSTSKIIFIKEFSIGVAAAVALDATIVRALLVPSLMCLLGRWNWWAPKPLRRLHERFGLTEA
jgi:RND superfamily putative drug exporter